MKKYLCLFLSIALLLSLAGCTKPPVDPVENPDPPVPTNEGPVDPGTPEDPTDDPAAPESISPITPNIATDPDRNLSLEIYVGTYRAEDPMDADAHYLEVRQYGDMLTLEHSLFMGESLYSFWVEEFWPDDDETFTDMYDKMHGLSQSFSEMTSLDAYSEPPEAIALAYNDAGIAIFRDGSDEPEHYTIESGLPVNRSEPARLQEYLKEMGDITLADGPVGRWYEWTGYEYLYVEFQEDGAFFWLRKVVGHPIEILYGVWTLDADGKLVILSERVGAGTQNYTTYLNWEYDADMEMLTFYEDYPVLIAEYDGYYYLYACDVPAYMAFYQMEALAYVTDAFDRSFLYENEAEGITYYCYYYLPRVIGYSETTYSLNEEIQSQFGTIIERSLAQVDNGERLDYDGVYWEQYVMGDILAIMVSAYGTAGELHTVYYYDPTTDTRLYARDVLAALGYDEQMYLDGLLEEALEAFDMHHYDATEEDLLSDEYWACLDWTMSADNINADRPFFVNDYGEVITYVQVETLYGTYWEAVYPFGEFDGEAVG